MQSSSFVVDSSIVLGSTAVQGVACVGYWEFSPTGLLFRFGVCEVLWSAIEVYFFGSSRRWQVIFYLGR